MIVLRILWRGVRLILRLIGTFVALVLFLFFIQRSTYPLHINWNAVSAIVRDHQFDYLTWELNAIGTKTAQALWGQHPYMAEAERTQFVRDYMTDLAQARTIEGEIAAIYADPAITDGDAATAELRAERDQLRSSLSERQATAESIMEGQVSTILVEEGFGTLGQVLPPVSMHFTQMPNLLVVSPRDGIDRAVELSLDPLPLEEVIEIEERIKNERDMAALVIPLGGMALFPAMIQESANLPWAIETFAHEWIHHYFFFFPLGQNYFTNSGGAREALIINETTADIFGKEIGQRVLERYYPEFVQETAAHAQTISHMQQEPFDFGLAMHVTRVQVDKALADIQGNTAKADYLTQIGETNHADYLEDLTDAWVINTEDYMEARRVLLYENGWRIRKLNQAFFAFYGGYQAGSRPGVGGADPIGPAVRAIRAASPTLHDFIVTMRSITTREALLEQKAQLQAENASDSASQADI